MQVDIRTGRAAAAVLAWRELCLRSQYWMLGVMVAYTPIPIPILAAPTLNPGVYEVSLFWWYFLSSFTFSTMLSRLLHTTP